MSIGIYKITNLINNKCYIGQSQDIATRFREHRYLLRQNKYGNNKIQNAWNKYGEEAFDFTYEVFDLENAAELNTLEKIYIRKYNSYENGYNLTPGGDGGEIRNKLNYDQFCLVYLGCQWKGYTMKLGEYLNVDSACISAILREVSYATFREKANSESLETKEYYQNQFRKIFNVPKDKTPDEKRVPSHLSEDEYFYCLCIDE